MSAKQIEIAGLPAFGTDSATARRLGAVMGLAVGDALGTTFEFRRIDQPNYPTLATGPATDVTGGGPFELPAGAITDDTQMAVCLARSLAAKRGLDVADIAARYLAWSKEAFDIGNQTGAALAALRAGTPPQEAGRVAWINSGRRAAGNGSLMRTAPIGVFFTGDAVVEAAIADAMLTHADPRCVIATAVFDASIAAAVAGDDVVAAARKAVPVVAARLDDADSAAEDIMRDLDAAEAIEPGVYGAELDVLRTAGFVRVAFRLAYWHAVHTPSWRDAVVDTASRGGDADTNAAIVGALLGARDGIGAIPRDWLDRVLGAKQRGGDAWSDDHHPRHFLALVA